MRVLITGGTGFVGARLIKHLVGDHEVFALARKVPDAPDARVRWLVQDLGEARWSVDLPSNVDAVVHLAQSPHFRDFPARGADIYAVSTATTTRLLDWALKSGARNFVLGSTGGLYGASDQPVTESHPVPEQRNQLGFYFASKRAAELLAHQYAGLLNVVTLRFFFIYGAGQPAQMLMPRLVASVREGKPIYLHGDDGIRLNPLHVGDAVAAVVRCLDLRESRLFNIAGPETTTLRAVANYIGRHACRDPIFVVDKITPPNHLVADIERMTRALGAPQVGIEHGIAELLGKSSP